MNYKIIYAYNYFLDKGGIEQEISYGVSVRTSYDIYKILKCVLYECDILNKI